MTEYKSIDSLRQAIIKNRMSFEMTTETSYWKEMLYEAVKIKAWKKEFVMLVADEYDDIPQGNALVILNLIIYECEEFENAADYLVWCNDKGLDASHPLVRVHYDQLRDTVPILREKLKDAMPISHADWERNGPETKALRAAEA